MPKSEIVSTAAAPKDLDKAYLSAVKALSVLGIKMATKKPDVDKLGAIMTKAKKKAEFKLTGDKAGVKLTAECNGTSALLGELDVDAVRDPEKRLAVLRSLVACDLMTQSEMDKVAATMRTGPDPKVAANEIRKKIEAAVKLRRPYDTIQTYDAAVRDAAYFKELQAQAATEHSSENLMFIASVEKNFSRDKIMAAFVTDQSKYQVNLPSPIRNPLLQGGADFGPAVAEIKKMIAKDTLPRLNKRKQAEINTAIKVLEAQLVKLGKLAA